MLDLRGTKNDEKLLRLGYIAEVPKDTVLKECARLCGAWFIDEQTRNEHFEKRHLKQSLPIGEQEVADSQRDEMLEQLAPVYMDRTKASIENRGF